MKKDIQKKLEDSLDLDILEERFKKVNKMIDDEDFKNREEELNLLTELQNLFNEIESKYEDYRKWNLKLEI